MTYKQKCKRKIQLLVLSGTQPGASVDIDELKELIFKYLNHSVGESSGDAIYTTAQIITRREKAFDNVVAADLDDLSDEEKETIILAVADGIVNMFCNPSNVDVQGIWNHIAYFASICEKMHNIPS